MTAVEPLPVDEARVFLNNAFGQVEDGWLTLFAVNRTTGDKLIRWRTVDDIDGLVLDAADLEPNCCVWFGAATRVQRTTGRGGAADYAAIRDRVYRHVHRRTYDAVDRLASARLIL